MSNNRIVRGLCVVLVTAATTACQDSASPSSFAPLRTVGAPGCLPVPPGLVSWWPGAVDGTDIQGPNHGALSGGMVAGAPAMVGGGFALDGTDDFLEAPDSPSLSITGSISLVAWVKVDFFEGISVISSGNLGGNGDESYALIVQGDRSAAILLNHGRYLNRNDLNRIEIGGGPLTVGQWHLLVGTFDFISGTIVFYIDGIRRGHLLVWSDVHVTGGLWGTSQPLLIGKLQRSGSPYPTTYFRGMIDEAQIYNRALSEAEVLAIYQAGSAGFCTASVEGPPTARISAVASWSEGDAVQFDGSTSTTDPAGGTLTYAWDFGDGSSGVGVSPSHVYGDDGPYLVSLTVTTPTGLQGTTTMNVSGSNLPPVLGAISAPIEPRALSSSISAVVSFNDPGSLDAHTAEIDWDADGSSTAAAATLSAGFASGAHSYSTPGVYAIKVTVTDDDGGLASSVFRYVVVYDPEAGFVSGGGHFDSPAGAYLANPGLTGRAQFAFVSRYKKGATVPTGNTQFKFQTANLDFSSASYEWLVVAGARAQYKGTGQINGAGDFGFLLTAIDGALPGGLGTDRIRIKIWDSAGGAVVYDNLVGGSDVADPVTALSAGSIIIHK